MIDLDRYKEILDTLSRNKRRSFLTGFGVFWGVFMLVALIGGGKAMKESLSNELQGFATNSAIIFPQATTKPYHGLPKGRNWCLVYNDVERLKSQVPGLDVVSPMLTHWGSKVTFSDKKSQCSVKGLETNYQQVETPSMFYGRYLNDMDMQQHRKVCVLGKKVYKTLFPGGGDPCGRVVCIDSIYYSIVGVDYGTSNMNINGRNEESVVIPLTLMQQAYNLGDSVHLMCATVRPGVTISSVTDKMREVIARPHHIDPTDEKGIAILNAEVMFGMVDSLFTGVDFLIWLVGIGTLLAGAIGVSNIMMVTVRERTTEIGIRRAIGATPRNILSQIITESITLTAVAGMSGILFAVVVLQLAEMANTSDGVVNTHFQVSFWTAVGAVVLLSLLGVLAGLAPAVRAMSIKPVDAMREE